MSQKFPADGFKWKQNMSKISKDSDMMKIVIKDRYLQ